MANKMLRFALAMDKPQILIHYNIIGGVKGKQSLLTFQLIWIRSAMVESGGWKEVNWENLKMLMNGPKRFCPIFLLINSIFSFRNSKNID